MKKDLSLLEEPVTHARIQTYSTIRMRTVALYSLDLREMLPNRECATLTPSAAQSSEETMLRTNRTLTLAKTF
jgi:hypothetical protein